MIRNSQNSISWISFLVNISHISLCFTMHKAYFLRVHLPIHFAYQDPRNNNLFLRLLIEMAWEDKHYLQYLLPVKWCTVLNFRVLNPSKNFKFCQRIIHLYTINRSHCPHQDVSELRRIEGKGWALFRTMPTLSPTQTKTPFTTTTWLQGISWRNIPSLTSPISSDSPTASATRKPGPVGVNLIL